MQVLFVASFGPIVPVPVQGTGFYVDTLSLPLEGNRAGCLHTERLSGVKHFALWLLTQAAQA